MKKLLSFALALMLVLTLSACGEKVEEKDYSDHDLTVYFVPSRPASEILTITAPLEAMLKAELAAAGYDVKSVKIFVSSSYEAAGIAMLSGTADIGYLPGGTYVMFADTVNSPIDVILSASRDGLNKDSYVAKDWNDGEPTLPVTEEQVNFYKGLMIAGTSAAARTLAAKVNAGTALVWDDVKDLNWCVRSATSSSGYIYPNLWVYENFDGHTFDDMTNVTETSGYGATMANLATGVCDVGTIYADARRDYADEWTTDYGRTATIWDETDVVGVTQNIMNDTISVSRVNLDQGIIDAITQAFLNIAQTDAGLAVMAVYSHSGYVIAEDSEYDGARALSDFMGDGSTGN
ncbi:MAG: PhnD/SsuA/transferrin family substrate-binding protein [Bacilli bacterium]|nr:PhnD/SsuA/transferrin family substrate-binding protein [Bacilli bacterium]